MIYWTTWAIVRVLLKLLLRLRSVDGDHLPRRGPVLLASNHVSYFDPPAIGVSFARRLHWLAKVELLRPRLFGWFLLKLAIIPVKRGAADRRALQDALRLLKEGEVVGIFLEGTRSETGDLQPPELGAGMIAVRSNAPVVPIYISGTRDAWRRNGRFRVARVTVRFGAPARYGMPAGQNPSRADYQRAADAIMEAIRRLRDEAAAAETPRAP